MGRDQAGFTLLEVLVAFIIAALALAALLQGGLGGLRSAAVAGRTQEAVARAQSHLDAATIALEPGDRQGDEGQGFHWRVRIVPLASQQAGARLTLFDVSAAVSWTEGGNTRAVQLDTQRTAAAPPPPP